VSILSRPLPTHVTGTDPIAASLRPLLNGSLVAQALDRQGEVRRAVAACRPAALATRPAPARARRRSRGLRRALALALFALVRRLAPDVVPC